MKATKRFGRFLVIAVLAVLGIASSDVDADTQAQIASGAAWLAASQNANGSWGTGTETVFRDTTTVLVTLKQISQQPAAFNSGFSYVKSTLVNSVDYISRKVELLALAGENVSPGVALLFTYQNANEGWGIAPGFDSDVLDTVLALEALTVAGQGGSTAAGLAVGFLMSRQQAGGGWADGDNVPSVYLTALSLRALWYYRHIYVGVPAALTNGKTFLFSQRDGAGLWGEHFNTALALLAVIPTLPDLSSVTTSINNLAAAQLANGSWANDAYTTALALQALYLASLPQPNPDFVRIQGKVVDALTGLPLSGVTVALSGAATAGVVTASDGLFLFKDLPAGSYSLQLTLANYATLSATTTASFGQTIDFGTLLMVKGASTTTGTVRGTITDATNGLPLSSVSVSATGIPIPALTDTSGQYQINNVPPGAVTLSASLAGYSSVTTVATLVASGVLVFSPALQPSASPGGDTAVEGLVTAGSTGQPLANVNISVSGSSYGSAITDALGHYRIQGLSRGAVTLSANLTGYTTVTAAATLYPNSTLTFSPKLYAPNSGPPDANTSGVIGVVLDAGTNAPLGSVSVVAKFGSLNRTITTDNQGRFRIDGITVTDGTLRFTFAGYVSADLQVILTPLTLLDLGQVRLRLQTANELLSDLTVTTVDRAGTVTDPQTLVIGGSVGVDIANIGTSDATTSTVLAFYDTNLNGVFDEGDIALGQKSMLGPLAVGDTVRLTIPISGVLPFRDAPIHIWVDSTRVVIELLEDNNVGSSASKCLSDPSVNEPKRYYGYNPATTGALTLLGFSNSTSYTVKSLLNGSTIANGTLNRLQRRVHSLGSNKHFVLESSAPLLAILSQNCCGAYTEVGSFFYPTPDGRSFYGKSFLVARIGLSFNNYSYIDVLANEEAQVTVRTATGGLVANSPVLPAGGNWRIPGLTNGGVYVIESTGSIAVVNNSHNGNTNVPPVPDQASGPQAYDDAGKMFLFPTFQWSSGAAAVMNPTTDIAVFTITNLQTGVRIAENYHLAPGQIYFNSAMGSNYYRLEASQGQITVWAGGTEGGIAIADMGDDITTNFGLGGRRFQINTQTSGAQLFAGENATEVKINGGSPQVLNRDQYLNLAPYLTLSIETDKPVTVQTLGGICCYPLNDWATSLRPTLKDEIASADLTASLLRLLDNGVGQPLSLSLRIGNGGAAPSPNGVVASFYQGDPLAGGVLLGNVALAAIAPGVYQDILLNNVVLPNTADLYAVVDSTNKVNECDETNNKAQIPLAVSAVRGSIGVATDSPAYGPNAPAVLSATITNTGALSASFTAQLLIEDTSGAVVTSFPARAVGPVVGGAVANLTEPWNTGTTLTGNYRLRGRLFDLNATLLQEATAPFTIGAAAGPVVSLRVTTDRPVYHTTDVVAIQNLIANLTTNVIVDNATLRITILDPANAVFFTKDGALGQLVPGALLDIGIAVPLSSAPLGLYRVEGKVLNAAQVVLATGSTGFEVRADLTKSLAGKATVGLSTLERGTPQTCTDTLTNVGSQPIANLEVHRVLVNLDTQVSHDDRTVTLNLAVGQVNTDTRTLATTGLLPGNHACVLQARIDGTLKTLAYAPFVVTVPPIKVDATLSLGAKGRVLVLLDSGLAPPPAKVSDADPHGPSGAPLLSAQRAFLEKLLKDNGWSYTITTSSDDFTRELHTGAYNLYAVFAEQEKLAETAQKELREAVFRGEGLVMAGIHDARHLVVHDALGIKLIGQVTQAVSGLLTTSPLGLTGSINLLAGDKTLRIKRLTAQSAGVYLLGNPPPPQGPIEPDCQAVGQPAAKPPVDECAGQPNNYLDAFTLNAYGVGKAFFAGFDLLARATLDGQTGLAAQTLLAALSYANPTPPRLSAGGVVPLSLALQNRGIAITVTATLTLPTGVSVVDLGSGILTSPTTVRWDLSLALDEAKTVTLWVRLPSTAGAITFNATVHTQAAPIVLLASPSTTLTVLSPIDLAVSLANVEALIAQNHPASQTLKQVSTFLTNALKAPKQDHAVFEVLKATDALLGFTDPALTALRAALGEWIREAGMRGY